MRMFWLLLRLYPAAFRRRFERELADAFAAIRTEPRYDGAAGRARLWIDVGIDVACSALRQRIREHLAVDARTLRQL